MHCFDLRTRDAHTLSYTHQSKKATKLAESVLLPWLTGENKNPLLYDTTWGGLVVQNGLSNPYANFGQTYYNDHHFQFGYFAYAAAVIAKLDAGAYVCMRPCVRPLPRVCVCAFIRLMCVCTLAAKRLSTLSCI